MYNGETESFNDGQQKEYKIGEFLTVGNCTYKVVEDRSDSCKICDFENEQLCLTSICSEFERTDAKPVAFILYDENTESTEE